MKLLIFHILRLLLLYSEKLKRCLLANFPKMTFQNYMLSYKSVLLTYIIGVHSVPP